MDNYYLMLAYGKHPLMLSFMLSLATCFIVSLLRLVELFFSWKWFLPAWRTVTLPLPVTWKRFAAALRVFSLPPRLPSAAWTDVSTAARAGAGAGTRRAALKAEALDESCICGCNGRSI